MRALKSTLVIILLLSTLMTEARSTLFKNGKTSYSIVLCGDASISEKTAAKELQSYLKQISGTDFTLIEEGQAAPKAKQIFIGFNDEFGKRLNVKRPDNTDESFTYTNVGKDIWIYGGKQRGTMYGVYSFLENELGIRWYTKDYTHIVKHDKWSFDKLYDSQSPAIRYRFDQYFNVEPHKEWLAHNKCNSVWSAYDNEYGGLSGYWGAHTFDYFVPASKYYDTHPEYFSLRDGKRQSGYTQLCLSNPEVLQLCIEGMKKVIADNPAYWVYSLSQNDNMLPCQCEKCQAIEKQYGGHSGLLIWFVNQVADAIKPIYPDKYIGTFAYQYTRQVPTGIKPRENVVIRLCDIECCFAHPLEECEGNRPFIEDIRKWSEIAPNLFIWDYVVNYLQYLAPFPNFGVLAQNIKTFKKYNAIGIQEEAQYETLGGEFSDMKAWVLSKLLWNPDLYTFELVAEFIRDYYGKAAPYIQQYFDLCHSLIKEDTFMHIYINELNPLYTDEFVKEARVLLDKARDSVADEDEDMKYRVALVRLQIQYLHMLRNQKEAIADGTRDEVYEIVSKNDIRVRERMGYEKFFEAFDKANNL